MCGQRRVVEQQIDARGQIPLEGQPWVVRDAEPQYLAHLDTSTVAARLPRHVDSRDVLPEVDGDRRQCRGLEAHPAHAPGMALLLSWSYSAIALACAIIGQDSLALHV